MRSHRDTSNSNDSYERMGWEYMHGGQYKKAIHAFDKSLILKQNIYHCLHGKGECFLELGDVKSAEECFNKAIHHNRHHSWAYHGLGRAYHLQGKYDAALASFDKSIHKDSNGVVAWYGKGHTLIETGDYENAELSLRKALENAIGRDYAQKYIPMIEADLKKISEMPKKEKESVTPQIVVQGNQGPVNIAGIQAADDAVVTRSSLDNSKDSDQSNKPSTEKTHHGFFHRQSPLLCPDCGKPIKKEDKYCLNCGRKLT